MNLPHTLPLNRPLSPMHNNSKVRKPLPTNAVEILKNWLFSPEHVSYPYPTQEEQKYLINATGLTSKQLKNWFTNARRRIWKKHVDACHPSGASNIRKKKKSKETKHRTPSGQSRGELNQTGVNFDSSFIMGTSKEKHLKQFFDKDLQDALNFLVDEPLVSSDQGQVHKQLFKSTNCFEEAEFVGAPAVSNYMFPTGEEVSGFIIDQSVRNTSNFKLESEISPPARDINAFSDMIFSGNNIPEVEDSSTNFQTRGSLCYVCNRHGNDLKIQDCGHQFHGDCLRIATLFYATEEPIRCPKCFTSITNCITLP